MWIATAMFGVFSAFMLLQALRARRSVKRLKEELTIIQYRESQVKQQPADPEGKQLSLMRTRDTEAREALV